MHDMSLTQSYAVVYDLPVTVDFDLAFAGRFPFRWNPDYGSRARAAAARGRGATTSCGSTSPICYSFHPMNAYDDARRHGRHRPLRLRPDVRHRHPRPVRRRRSPGSSAGRSTPSTRTMSTTVIDAAPTEFPRHRARSPAKPYRYGYCASPGDSTPTLADAQVRPADRRAGRCSTTVRARSAASRCSSAGRRSTDEDDGWLDDVRPRRRHGRAELVVLDAQDFARGYVARVPLPQRVPFGFHGNWVSDRSVAPPGNCLTCRPSRARSAVSTPTTCRRLRQPPSDRLTGFGLTAAPHFDRHINPSAALGDPGGRPVRAPTTSKGCRPVSRRTR